jgi:hypothetical protein
MTDLSEIAVAVPVLSRSEALAQFIESVPPGVSRVIVADNGMPGEHAHVYTRDWHVDIDVLDLEFDIGIGACRAALVEAVTEPYLWMGDCDMQMVAGQRDLARLREILDSDAQLGGVSGWLVEGGTLRSAARDIRRPAEDVMLYDATDATVRHEPHPHAHFDFVPQAGLFDTAVYDTYTYDAAFTCGGEHGDFFIGQLEAGEWRFASTPSVVVRHHKQIDQQYRRQQERNGDEVLERKRGISLRLPGGRRWEWKQPPDRGLHERAFDAFRSATPARVWLPVRRACKTVGLD